VAAGLFRAGGGVGADIESRALPEYVVRGSHRVLVPRLPELEHRPQPKPGVAGLVVVPLSRREPMLATAAEIAGALSWPLLLLCSHGNQARRVYGMLRKGWPELDVTAVDLLQGEVWPARWHTSTSWHADGHTAARAGRRVDTNRKRNLGLAAARITSASWVLFVDDDIMRLSPSHVTHVLTSPTATRRTVASWFLEYFPDNSVVHHARRDFLGLHQDMFLSGGALLVRIGDWDPPVFPPVYNEDWLFLFEPIRRGNVVAAGGVGQATYDPYDTPGRASYQEFGDVLGEGLYHLLHENLSVDVAFEGDYWRSVHAKRTKLIQMIIAELRRRLAVVATEAEHDRLTRALASILESRHQLTRATPESLADFVVRWRQDEELWREYVAHLPQRDTLKEALVYLGLHESWIVSS
jgi:hypothetical protein